MKNNMILACGVLCAVALTAPAAEIFHADYRTPDAAKNAVALSVNRKQADASYSAEPDGVTCLVTKPGEHIVSVEFYARANVKLTAGKTYKLQFRMKSNRAARVIASCYLNRPQWTSLGAEATQKWDLPADRWYDAEMIFTSAIDADRVRIPSLRLGRVPAGTRITLQSVRLEELDAAAATAKPVFRKDFMDMKGVNISVNRAKQCEAVLSGDSENLPQGANGAAKVVVGKRGSHPADIQLMVNAPCKLTTGATYRVEFLYMVSKPAELPVEILCQQQNRFFRPAPNARMTLSTAGGVWEKAALEFTVENEISNKTVVRIPNFCLGRLPDGSVFRCANVTMLQVK